MRTDDVDEASLELDARRRDAESSELLLVLPLCAGVFGTSFLSRSSSLFIKSLNKSITSEDKSRLPDAKHDVFIGNEAIFAILGALPPVARHLRVQSENVALFEAQLASRTGLEVELGSCFERFCFCEQIVLN